MSIQEVLALCVQNIDTTVCFRLDNIGSHLLSDDEDEENFVELEKSNVLLIGPTGSGIISLLHSFSMHRHTIYMCAFLYLRSWSFRFPPTIDVMNVLLTAWKQERGFTLHLRMYAMEDNFFLGSL